MYWRLFLSILFLVSFLVFSSFDQYDEESAIIKQAKAYVIAFNRSDSRTLANLWAEDAKYVDPETEEEIIGRDAIEEMFRDNFEDLGKAQLVLDIHSITFPTRNSAVETGTATIKSNGDIIEQTSYKVIYEKINGKWLIAEAREVEKESPPEENPKLKELEWLIGTWIDEDEDSRIVSNFQWDKYKNFITQHFTVSIEGQLELEGKQVIGWDPVKKIMRSWIFDSDGTFGEGIWKKKGDSWLVESSQTLSDGRRASSINIYTPKGPDSFTWRSTGREVGGELLPDVEPVTVIKKKERL